MLRRTREQQLRQRQVIEWWRARAALNERLAAITDELSEDSPLEAFAAAIEEIRRLEPLFQDAPDPELDRLNKMRRDLLVEALRLAQDGEVGAASDLLDQVAGVTDAAVERLEQIFS